MKMEKYRGKGGRTKIRDVSDSTSILFLIILS